MFHWLKTLKNIIVGLVAVWVLIAIGSFFFDTVKSLKGFLDNTVGKVVGDIAGSIGDGLSSVEGFISDKIPFLGSKNEPGKGKVGTVLFTKFQPIDLPPRAYARAKIYGMRIDQKIDNRLAYDNRIQANLRTQRSYLVDTMIGFSKSGGVSSPYSYDVKNGVATLTINSNAIVPVMPRAIPNQNQHKVECYVYFGGPFGGRGEDPRCDDYKMQFPDMAITAMLSCLPKVWPQVRQAFVKGEQIAYDRQFAVVRQLNPGVKIVKPRLVVKFVPAIPANLGIPDGWNQKDATTIMKVDGQGKERVEMTIDLSQAKCMIRKDKLASNLAKIAGASQPSSTEVGP